MKKQGPWRPKAHIFFLKFYGNFLFCFPLNFDLLKFFSTFVCERAEIYIFLGIYRSFVSKLVINHALWSAKCFIFHSFSPINVLSPKGGAFSCLITGHGTEGAVHHRVGTRCCTERAVHHRVGTECGTEGAVYHRVGPGSGSEGAVHHRVGPGSYTECSACNMAGTEEKGSGAREYSETAGN